MTVLLYVMHECSTFAYLQTAATLALLMLWQMLCTATELICCDLSVSRYVVHVS
jgi:hypothetical protein